MSSIQCIKPDEIQEGDLVAYLHGEAPPEIGRHVARCAFCAGEVEECRMVDARLFATFYRDACPAPALLADFGLGRLAAAERLRVAAHVRGCSLCAQEISAMRGLADAEPPSLLAQLREALALALTLQPVAAPALAVRGRGWQGRFEVDQFIVTISVQGDKLTGRVRRREDDSTSRCDGQAWLLREQAADSSSIPHSEIDERGRFRFSALTAGTYAMLLQVGEQDVAVEAVQVT